MEINDLIIREMAEGDVPEVVKIEQDLFTDPWPDHIFLDDISVEFSYPFVAQLDNQLVGYTIMVADDQYGHITNMAVARKYQRKSIAKKLLSFILELAVEKKLERVTLEVRLSNRPAIELYESFGFLPLTVEKDYYRNPVEDCLIMIMDLTADWR